MIENIIITIPKKPDVNKEFIIDLGTIFVGFLVSSDISAAASKPVKHHAPNKIDKAKDSNPMSEILKSLVIFEIEKSFEEKRGKQLLKFALQQKREDLRRRFKIARTMSSRIERS